MPSQSWSHRRRMASIWNSCTFIIMNWSLFRVSNRSRSRLSGSRFWLLFLAKSRKSMVDSFGTREDSKKFLIAETSSETCSFVAFSSCSVKQNRYSKAYRASKPSTCCSFLLNSNLRKARDFSYIIIFWASMITRTDTSFYSEMRCSLVLSILMIQFCLRFSFAAGKKIFKNSWKFRKPS